MMPQRQVCAFWVSGNCPFGNACQYLHPPGPQQPQQQQQQQLLPLAESAMDVSNGLLAVSSEVMLNNSQDGSLRAVLEHTWGKWLQKCVFCTAPTFFGSTAGFGLDNIVQVLHTECPNSLHDCDQAEELCIFKLDDGRISLVWVAHCVQERCCGRCLNSIVGYVGSNGQELMEIWRSRKT